MTLEPKVVDFDKLSEEFLKLLETIFCSPGTMLNGMAIYELVFDCCNATPDSLGERLLNGIIKYLIEHAQRIKKSLSQSDNLVRDYAKEWQQYRQGSIYLNDACDYLNRQMKQKCNVYSNEPASKLLHMTIQNHAYLVWQTHVLSAFKEFEKNELIQHVLLDFDAIRNGDNRNLLDLKQTILSFLELNEHGSEPLKLYQEEFETPFLLATMKYFKAESKIKVESLNTTEFIDYAVKRIFEEERLVKELLHQTSFEKVVSICETAYIVKNMDRILEEFLKSIREEDVDRSRSCFLLVCRIENGLQKPADVIEKYAKECVVKVAQEYIPTSLKDPSSYISALHQLQSRLFVYCKNSFDSEPSFEAAIDKSFRAVFNDQESFAYPYSELFAKYCDQLLKKNSKTVTVNAEAQIMSFMKLFLYVDEKDLFQKFYSRSLAKRLILNTSASMELEVQTLAKLKEMCGFEFVSKMQRMFTDVELSQELTSEFKKSREGKNVDFNVLVLTTGSWPLPNDTSANYNLPLEIEKGITEFNSFYCNGIGKAGRKLTWNHLFSRGEIKTTFLDKTYEISLSLKQLICLLPFNEKVEMTLDELVSETELTSGEIQKILTNFVDLGLILNDSAQKYRLNLEFTNKRVKLKLPMQLQTDTKSEVETVKKVVQDDRRFYLQALIVRIMKTRLELSHTELINEVLSQSSARFKPTIPMLKNSIEVLIEKQYIARTEQTQHYVYIS